MHLRDVWREGIKERKWRTKKVFCLVREEKEGIKR